MWLKCVLVLPTSVFHAIVLPILAPRTNFLGSRVPYIVFLMTRFEYFDDSDCNRQKILFFLIESICMLRRKFHQPRYFRELDLFGDASDLKPRQSRKSAHSHCDVLSVAYCFYWRRNQRSNEMSHLAWDHLDSRNQSRVNCTQRVYPEFGVCGIVSHIVVRATFVGANRSCRRDRQVEYSVFRFCEQDWQITCIKRHILK